jgi:hypothetical protein
MSITFLVCLRFHFDLRVGGLCLGHVGALDAYGCHNNRKLGGYHCHRGQFAGESFSSQQEMLQKVKQGKQATNTPPAQNFTGSDTRWNNAYREDDLTWAAWRPLSLQRDCKKVYERRR